MRSTLIFIIILVLPILLVAQNTIQFDVDFTQPLTPISPFIYGSNQVLSSEENWTMLRLGGNRLTGYNWENNASNAGADWYHSSDAYMGGGEEPGMTLTTFHDRSLDYKAASIITIQMAGYVAKDKNGQVSEAETAPSNRWLEVRPQKGSQLDLKPDINDNFVYVDELVNFLIDKYNTASNPQGIKGYCLDNEPALWNSTHPRIHPAQATCLEIIQKCIDYASAIKNIDPDADVIGPCLYGFAAYTDFQAAPDWDAVKSGKDYNWFIDYFLDNMKNAEADSGKRLLNVLDIHWYPEAQGDHRITSQNANTEADNLARVQAPRTLWDPDYFENSWIGQWGKPHLPLIPKLKASIDKYYPGTKIAFNEINYGGANHISGAIAIADILGIFAKYRIYMSSLWPLAADSEYISTAYKVFRNYDGNYSTFGDLYAVSQTSDHVNSSVYGSVLTETNKIHIIAINKSFNNSITGRFNVQHTHDILNGRVWCVDSNSVEIREIEPVNNITDNSFEYLMPPVSVCHFVLSTSNTTKIDYNLKNTPTEFYLNTYPNPFNSLCKIIFKLPVSSNSKIYIYAIKGNFVKTFGNLSSSGSIVWDGTNNNHKNVASGIYTIVFQGTDQIIKSKKIIYLK